MGQKFLLFLKKHTTIYSRAILAVYTCILLYRAVYHLFDFSIIRFLKDSLGPQFFIIGSIMAVANFMMILLDFPLGALMKYVRPRVLMLGSTVCLVLSIFIFMVFSKLSLFMAILACVLFQLSIEIFFLVIATYILRLSNASNYAQNMGQKTISESLGKALGFGLGGLLFFLDRLFHFQNDLVIIFITLFALLVHLYIVFVIDVEHYNKLEQQILKLKAVQNLSAGLEAVSTALVVEDTPATAPPPAKLPAFSWKDFWAEIQLNLGNVWKLILQTAEHPAILWGMAMLLITYFWYTSITTFEPIFTKDIFNNSTGWIAENVPRYFFESAMLILGILIPTMFTLQLGKIADRWGKWKMVVVGTTVSGMGLLLLSLIQTPGMVFLLYLIMVFGFVTISPSLLGFLGQEFKKVFSSFQKSPEPASAVQSEEDTADSQSAVVISILMNLGQVLGGVLGGGLIQVLDFQGTFLVFAVMLIVVAVGSILFFTWQRMTTS